MAAGVRVWDEPVRLFHWALVALIGCSWWTGKTHAMDWHRLSGYAILGLVVFRLFWGFAGPRTARFADFVGGPRRVLAYARRMSAPPERPGHNPVGGWSVVAMLGALAVMVSAGLFAVDVDGLESGPLSDWLSFDTGRQAAHVHAFVFNLLLGLIGLHVLAIVVHRVWFRHDLLRPMITGRSRDARPDAGIMAAPLWRLLVGVVLAVGVAWAAAHGFFLNAPA